MFDIKIVFFVAILMVSGMVEARSVATGAGESAVQTAIKRGFKEVSPVLVTREEQRQILLDELAATITAMLDGSGYWLPTLQQLGSIVHQQKVDRVMTMDDDDIGNKIRARLADLRRDSERLTALVEKEVLGELTREDIDSFYIGDGSEDSAVAKMISELFDNYSEVEIRDRIQAGWREVNAILDKITAIAAIKDRAKQRRALANYEADFERSNFENFVGAAKESGRLDSELPYSDTKSMVRSAYLDRLFNTELQQLAQALERHDLSKVETKFDRYMREGRELAAQLKEQERQKIAKLSSVLQQIAVQKQQVD